MRVATKDLKRNTDYYLTYDYWPKGGTKVRLVKILPAKEVWSGMKGDGAIVKDDEGERYFVHPKAMLFGENPVKP